MKILKKDNSPFKTEHAAAIFAGQLKLTKGTFTIVPEGDGYAIDSQVEIRPIEGAKKHRVTTPWKPATLLDIPGQYKDPDFIYRFCDKKRDGNIEKKIAEGWEIDNELSRKMRQVKPTIEDGAALDTTTGIRELVVMRMRKETAQARNEYFAGLTEGALKKTADQLKQDLHEAAGEYTDSPEYGEIKVETY